MSFADAFTKILKTTGDVRVSRARLGKGDAARTIWVPPDKAEAPGGSLVYIHTDGGDADNLQSRPTEASTAQNPRGLLEYGAPVVIAERKGTNYRVILDYDGDALPGFVSASGKRSIGAPLHSHGTFSQNPVWLDSRQIVNMSVQPKAGFGLTVQLIATTNRTVYLDDAGAPGVLANNIDIDLTTSIPATPGTARWVTISLDTASAAAITTDGPEFAPLASTLPVIRDVLAGNLIAPSAGLGVGVVYLAHGQTGVGHEHIRSIERGTSSGVGISSETNYAESNLIMGFPTRTSQAVLDNTTTIWWNAAAAAIVKENPASYEGVPAIHKRVIKVAAGPTDPEDDYCYQQYDPVYEDLLDPGETVVSLGMWIYNPSIVGLAVATIELRDTVDGVLAEAQSTVKNEWEYITIENVVIGDNDLELRIYGNSGNMVFYITMPMLNVGPRVLSWRPRGTRFVETSEQLSAFSPPDANWLTVNVTAQTHPLAVAVDLTVELSTVAAASDFEVRRPGYIQLWGGAMKVVRARADANNTASKSGVLMDDAQNLDVRVNVFPASYELYCYQYERWE